MDNLAVLSARETLMAEVRDMNHFNFMSEQVWDIGVWHTGFTKSFMGFTPS